MAKSALMKITRIHLWQLDLPRHRVSPVIGSRKRIVAMFCYDRNPGMVFEQSYIDELHESMPH